MKYILNIIRWIFIIFLLTYGLSALSFYIDKKEFNKKYSEIAGYSYYRVDNNYLLPDIKENEIVILKTDQEPKIDDYVLLYDNSLNKLLLKKIIKIENNEYILNYPNYNEGSTINRGEVLAVSIYHNKTLTLIFDILTSWPVIILMVLYVYMYRSFSFKRYE